jgi:hypothetical protein
MISELTKAEHRQLLTEKSTAKICAAILPSAFPVNADTSL